MAFSPTARIDLDALRHNLGVARAAASGRRAMAVIKADAYGHGLTRVAAALSGADALAVARLDEAVRLRDAGCRQPVLLLEGCLDAGELAEAARLGFTLVIHHPEQLALLASTDVAQPLACWLKVDTGMHRLGFTPEQAVAAWQRLAGLKQAAGTPGLMTHLANADDRDDPVTGEQLARFAPLAERLGAQTSIANSAGILGWPDSHGDWVRPGLMLYGASPFVAGQGSDHGLRPAMTLSARLIAINALKAGDPVGYGGTFRCPADMTVGVVGIGYGDGYPREIAPGTPVSIGGVEAPIVGRVSMDMLTVDLRGHPAAGVGDEVVLWGADLPLERIAAAAGTIPYTLTCGVTARVRHLTIGSES